ncbi:hypothetical protein A1F99_137340 [Pyrenophora tritici-repentis]|nr:hypothetical protein A1F99_137340 [Pyrenophora tritici-repentis]
MVGFGKRKANQMLGILSNLLSYRTCLAKPMIIEIAGAVVPKYALWDPKVSDPGGNTFQMNRERLRS